MERSLKITKCLNLVCEFVERGGFQHTTMRCVQGERGMKPMKDGGQNMQRHIQS